MATTEPGTYVDDRPVVLLCAPDPLAEDLVGSLLWSPQLTRHLASNLTAGLIFAVAARPHLVIVDAALRDAEGLIRCLRHDPAANSTAIAAVSRGAPGSHLALLIAGADAVFQLPFSVEAGHRLTRLLWAAMAQRSNAV